MILYIQCDENDSISPILPDFTVYRHTLTVWN